MTLGKPIAKLAPYTPQPMPVILTDPLNWQTWLSAPSEPAKRCIVHFLTDLQYGEAMQRHPGHSADQGRRVSPRQPYREKRLVVQTSDIRAFRVPNGQCAKVAPAILKPVMNSATRRSTQEIQVSSIRGVGGCEVERPLSPNERSSMPQRERLLSAPCDDPSSNRRGRPLPLVKCATTTRCGFPEPDGRSCRSEIEISSFDVETNPVTLYQLPGQTGPIVVVAHGFAGSGQIMQAYSLNLAQAGYRVLAFDFQGHGRNPIPMSGDVNSVDGTTALLVAETRRVIAAARTLPGAGPIASLGHSMATDIIVRASIAEAKAGTPIDAVVAVSVFSQAVTGDQPARLLVISRQWESFLRQSGPDALYLVDPKARRRSRGGRRRHPAGSRSPDGRTRGVPVQPDSRRRSARLAGPDLRAAKLSRGRPLGLVDSGTFGGHRDGLLSSCLSIGTEY